MAFEIQTTQVAFGSLVHTDEARMIPSNVLTFSQPVRNAYAMLTGFDIQFSNGEPPMRPFNSEDDSEGY